MTTQPVDWTIDGCPQGQQYGRHVSKPLGWRWAGRAVPVEIAIGLVTGCGNDDSLPAPVAISEASATIGAG